MIARIVLLASLLTPALAGAQAAPSTDIYLIPITVSARDTATLVAGSPINVTHRAGYDNQPAFAPDGRTILYTSTRDDGQADIYRYEIATRRTSRVTSTPESEYSPTFIPGTRRFSVVRVERDSAQRLWSFAIDGSDPRPVLRTIKPVGYHAWLDTAHVALFVLGKPATLQVATLGTEHVDTVARDIARSLVSAGVRSASFAQRQADTNLVLTRLELDPASARSRVTPVGTMPKGAEFVAWTPTGAALTASGSRLFILRPGHREWEQVVDLAADGISDVTRLALSPNGRWLAVVADDGR